MAPIGDHRSPGDASEMADKVVKGSLWTFAGTILPVFVSLVTTPFTVRFLGAEGYGLFSLVALLLSYLAFADLGMSLASTRFGSVAFGQKDAKGEANVVRTSLVIALAGSVPVVAATLSLADAATGWLNIADHLKAEAASVIRIASLILLLNILTGVVNTPQLARLRMDLASMIGSGIRIASQVGVPVILYLGYGLVSAVWFLAVVSMAGLVLNVAVSSRLLPQLLGLSIDRSMLRSLLGFGLPLVGAGVAAALLTNGEKALVAGAVSTAALGHYAVAYSLAQVVTVASHSIIQSLIPAFSQLQMEGSHGERKALFSSGIRMCFLVVTPGIFFLAAIAEPFLNVWVGPEFALNSVVPLYILLIGLSFNIFAFIPYAAVMAAGRSDVTNRVYWIELIPFLAIAWVMTKTFGLPGAAAAWSIRAVVDAGLQFFLAKRFASAHYEGRSLAVFIPGPVLMIGTLAVVLLFLEAQPPIALVLMLAAVAGHIFIAFRLVLEESETGMLRRRLGVGSR